MWHTVDAGGREIASIRSRKISTGQVRWHVEIRIKGHRPQHNTFHSKGEAKRWATRVENDLRQRRLSLVVEAEKHTVSEAIDRYLENHLSDLSRARYRLERARHLEWWRQHIGHLSLARVGPAHISDAVDALQKRRNLAGGTINRYLAAISAVFRYASGPWQWMTTNPMSGVKPKKEHRGRLRFLSEEERDSLLMACQNSRDPRLHPFVLMALNTGARQGELLNLKWSDVNLVNRVAIIHQTKNTDRRAVYFSEEARDILESMKATPHISGYVFAGGKTRQGPPRMMLTPWKRAVAEAELEDFRFHDLRHTFASYAAMSGATLTELMDAMGHRTVEMVRRYAHLTDQHQKAMVERMWDKFGL